MITAQRDVVLFGFDSAWTDHPKAPGAICALAFDAVGGCIFHPPKWVRFAQAAAYIVERRAQYRASLIAIDQPSVVPNATGMRPVERVAASVMSYIGGGVQPANRGKRGMFDGPAPVWRFMEAVAARQAPDEARRADRGDYLIEVFPALALAALHAPFAERLGAAKYNPGNRRTYRADHWVTVCRVAADTGRALGVPALAEWAEGLAGMDTPVKGDQDRLDAVLCVLVGLIWRAAPAEAALCVGDTTSGFMVTPVSDAVRARLTAAALMRGVAIG